MTSQIPPNFMTNLILLALFLGSAVWAQPKNRGARLLSIDLNEAEEGGFELAMAKAKQAGAQVISMPQFWDDLEARPGEFNPNPNWLAIANAFYPGQGMKVSLIINPIDTGTLRLPADLKDRSFDDPVVIERFKALLDWIFLQIPDLELASLVIGNEIDGYLGNDPKKWQAYSLFLDPAMAHIRRSRPKLVLGTKIMYFSYSDNRKRKWIRRINKNTDAWMVTYYPLKPDFSVRDPSQVQGDLGWLVRTFTQKPVYFMETGYPSARACASSEAKQAQFIEHIFAAWDRHAERIPYISFTWLTDIAPAATDHYVQYYGLDSPGFRGFLSSIGLRTRSGQGKDKPAWTALVNATKARGW